MVTDRLLIHDVVIVHPVANTVEGTAYGPAWDYGTSATRSTVPGWLDLTRPTEEYTDGRDIVTQRWTLITNATGIDDNNRIEWAGHPAGGTMIFSVDGPPAPLHGARGRDHMETRLIKVEG
jgi:hypothetical protein